MTSSSLNNLRILVTRSSPQGEALCAEIDKQGGKAIYLPTLEIKPLLENTQLQQQLADLDKLDWLIFISPQAVLHSAHLIKQHGKTLPAIAAVGAGTAAALTEQDMPADVYPADQWSSEGLLKLSEFQNISGKRIGIVRGEGGREFLAEELTKRGAIVTPLVAYQRCLPVYPNLHEYIALLRTKKIDAVVVTSGESLHNLLNLFGADKALIKALPLIVVSERLEAIAKELHFKTVRLAKNASQEAIINACKEYLMPENTVEKPKSMKLRNISITFIALAIIVLILTATFAGSGLLKVNASLAQSVSDLHSKVKNMQAVSDSALQEADALKQSLQTQQGYIEELRKAQTMTKDDLRVLQAQFYVKRANDMLQYENNPSLALKYLQAADQEMSGMVDPRLDAIRKTLTNDISVVQAVPKVDLPAVYSRFVALNVQVDRLTFQTRYVPQPVGTEGAVVNVDKTWWQRALHTTWQGLSRIVVVRKMDERSLPFIVLPTQQILLYQNLHAQFDTAQWALVHSQEEIYRASLQQSILWIKQFMDADAPLTQQVLLELTQLQQINVKPPLPTVATTLQQFQGYFVKG